MPTRIERSAFAACFFMADYLSPRLRGQFGGCVPRAIIHHDHIANHPPHCLRQLKNSRLLV